MGKLTFMPVCECGFSFAAAHLQGLHIESYAVVRNRDWLKLMRKERAVLAERKSDKRLALIGDAAQWVGNLMCCPECGAWLLLKPQEGQPSPIVLLKPAPFTQRARSTRRRVRAPIGNSRPVARRQ